MTNLPPRPTWTLGDEALPTGHPASILDPSEAFAAALAADPGYDRYGDVSEVEKAAVTYAAETMRDAIAGLAFFARRAAPAPLVSRETGWLAFHEPGPSKTHVDLVLVHPGQPGAWHVSVEFQQEMLPEAAARTQEIEAGLHAALVAGGASEKEAFLAAILGSLSPGRGEPSPEKDELVRIGKSQDSYRDAREDDRVVSFSATGLILGKEGWNGIGLPGAPVGPESSDCVQASTFLPIKAYPEIWWPGMQVIASPQKPHERAAELLRPGNERSRGSASVPMVILSDLIRSMGLEPLVTRRDAQTSPRSWMCFGSERSALLADAGHSAVHASGGLFDAAVACRLRDFSAGIAAHDVERNVGDWFALAPLLVEKGFTDMSSRYDCNDMDDFSFAEVSARTRRVVLETQHGIFRIDMREGEDGGVSAVEAARIHVPDPDWTDPDCASKKKEIRSREISSFDERIVGRFAMTQQGLRADYSGMDGGPSAIDYTIRNVRDMNGIIASLSSTCCCFEEDFINQAGGMEP